MKNPPSGGLIYLKSHGKESKYHVFEARIAVKGVDGKLEQKGVAVDLVINHAALNRLVQKAHDNKSKQSSDGPVTVRVLDSILTKRCFHT